VRGAEQHLRDDEGGGGHAEGVRFAGEGPAGGVACLRDRVAGEVAKARGVEGGVGAGGVGEGGEGGESAPRRRGRSLT
jgi:hypothetical protein